ncbi:SCP2 domain-containing protein [Mycena kentingensis (nom. inval.)]|nr:SCP2 domain-containing protein [Mycena kentingensis (nom. inval.)]
MSELKVPGFKASELIAGISEQFNSMSDAEKAAQVKKARTVNGVIELEVTNAEKTTATWTLDLKKTGTVSLGKAKPKADVTVILADDTLMDLASGKLNGQKAFMTGKLKTKGNMMLATKLDSVFKAGRLRTPLSFRRLTIFKAGNPKAKL